MFTIKRNNFMLRIKENILVRLKVVLVCLVLSIILRGNTICISCNNWHHSKRMRLQEILSYFKLLSYIKLYETWFQPLFMEIDSIRYKTEVLQHLSSWQICQSRWSHWCNKERVWRTRTVIGWVIAQCITK